MKKQTQLQYGSALTSAIVLKQRLRSEMLVSFETGHSVALRLPLTSPIKCFNRNAQETDMGKAPLNYQAAKAFFLHVMMHTWPTLCIHMVIANAVMQSANNLLFEGGKTHCAKSHRTK